MQQVTVGPKYQIVIPKEVRRKIKGLRPGTKVNIAGRKGKITVEPVEQTWIERTSGMMTEYWKGIDTTKYLEDLRNEWEEKLEEQAKIWKAGRAKPG